MFSGNLIADDLSYALEGFEDSDNNTEKIINKDSDNSIEDLDESGFTESNNVYSPVSLPYESPTPGESEQGLTA